MAYLHASLDGLSQLHAMTVLIYPSMFGSLACVHMMYLWDLDCFFVGGGDTKYSWPPLVVLDGSAQIARTISATVSCSQQSAPFPEAEAMSEYNAEQRVFKWRNSSV
jgi:hypothetical protein